MAKQQIIKAIENCDDEQLKNRMYTRVARRYCAVHRITNIVNDDGSITRPALPSVEKMVKALNDERCYQILTSPAFKTYFKEYGETMKCCECWECAGLDCPVISQMEADDIAAYKQMEKQMKELAKEEEEMFNMRTNEDGEIIEDEGYGGGAFSSLGDYCAYRFNPNY